jgi:hypothetical protein
MAIAGYEATTMCNRGVKTHYGAGWSGEGSQRGPIDVNLALHVLVLSSPVRYGGNHMVDFIEVCRVVE